MKFLCDAMLAHVGKRLRLAGYDTFIDYGKRPDRELLDQANAEGRFLLTCDHQLRQHKNSDAVLYLPNNDELGWAKHLSLVLGVQWTHAPFSRCLDCNTEIRAANELERQRLPRNIRLEGQEGFFCELCDKVFWNGSHVERMRQKLEDLDQL
jgi:uncharacterized protein with PIN domain